MKRFSLLLLFGLLGGCIIITPDPVIPTPIEIIDPSFETNVTANGQIAICSNRVTQIAYTFRHTGDLASWSSFLKGNTIGTEILRETYTPTTAGVEAVGTDGYRTTFNIAENTAPYSAGTSGSTSKAIVVVPVPQPVQIGSSKLYLTLTGTGGDTKTHTFSDIPVIENCPTS